MKNLLVSKKLKAGLLVAATVVSGSALAEASAEVTAATTSFQGFFTDNANLIGGVMLTAAFVAIGWKWLKGTAFS
ncbi:hypothetical protein H5200_15855 [Pseudoalteromonas sp. SG43-7]|uniref:hypothetical protein n=1 Tax=unclassified Pseudoalteromonas TaxID=194690 RepID=UPI0015FEFD3F|nr:MULTISPECIES: hypothetical protein [unclassified Pseudoalteromonas]MBB1335963.1 hypothetical protein [Pseudoalteromonas sp. SR41-6]MBB1423385.1 hypothetical protein [Pseudoalteromonas sp. SG43-7]MBB1461527.1 hypothetical protein [Pseudoalteromonas sp. SG41-8]